MVIDNHSHKVLVTGATGAIGPRVVQALHYAGYPVRALSIDKPKPELFPSAVEVIETDVADRLSVRSAMQGVGSVIHLAALLHVANPAHEIRMEYERVNVKGTETIIDEATKANVRRVVMFSTIAVYGRGEGQVISEESPAYPDTCYGQTKLAAEKIVIKANRLNGQPLGVVLRMAAIYGSRVKGNYFRLIKALERKRFIPIGDGANRRSLIYDKDAAHAAVLAMQHPVAAGRIYNVTDGQFHTVNEIIAAICEALGRRVPRHRIPIRPIRSGVWIAEISKLLFSYSKSSLLTAVEKYMEDIPVDGRRIQDELGFRPKYDLLSGWKEAIEEMRARGDF